MAEVGKEQVETDAGTTEQQDGGRARKVSWFKLLSTADRLDVTLMVVGTVCALVAGATLPAFTIFFGDFTNIFGSPAAEFQQQVDRLAGIFAILAAIAGVTSWANSACWMWTGARQTNRLRERYLESLLHQEIAFFDVDQSTGKLLQGLNEDAIDVQNGISEKVGNFVQMTATFFFGYGVAFFRGWEIALVMLGTMPFLAGIAAYLGKVTSTMQTVSNDAYAQANSVAQQSMSQVRTVTAYGRQQQAYESYQAALELPVKVGQKQAFVLGSTLGAMMFVMYCSYAAAFGFGAWRVSLGVYDGGDVMTVIIATIMGGFMLGMAAPSLQKMASAATSGVRIFDVIERDPLIRDDPSARQLDSVEGRLQLQDVTFAYPARPDIILFKGFSLDIKAGKTLALVGSSGSGKSTVVGLIERYYDPMSGAVLLDGVDIRTLQLKWYRSQMALVSQEPTLFATTIFENIAIGQAGATQAEVEAAARMANAHDFIASLPQGYNTHVGERGLQMSGGQKQRIAISRALLKNPKILLLDEATSALDSASEAAVQATLDQLMVGRTSVVVAHRLSTVRGADVIAVVSEGRVVEQGSHEKLIENPNGAYSTLVALQTQKALKQNSRQDSRARAAASRTNSMMAQEEEHHIVLEEEEDDEEAPAATASRTSSASLAVRSVIKALGIERKGSKDAPVSRKASKELQGVEVGNGKVAEGEGKVADVDPVADGKKSSKKKKKAKAEPEYKVDTSFKRLMYINRPEWGYVAGGTIGAIVMGCIMPVYSFLFSDMITVFYLPLDQIMAEASFYCWMFFMLAVVALVAICAMQTFFGVAAYRLARRVRLMLFASIMRQEIGWFDREENSSGVLSSRMASDANHVRGAVGDAIGVVLQNAATLIFGFAIAYSADWRLALLVTGCLPLIAAGQMFSMKFMHGMTNVTDQVYAGANQYVNDALGSVRVVAAYNLQGYVTTLYHRTMDQANRKMAHFAQVAGASQGSAQFMMFALYALVVWFGAWEIQRGYTDFNSMLKAFFAIVFVAMGIGQSAMNFPDIGKASSAVQNIFPTIDRPSKIDPTDEAGEMPPHVEGHLQLRSVRFAYPARPSIIIFRDLHLDVAAGHTLALVGSSGSGKSTVVGLIERFYDPVEGAVLLDGVDLRRLNIQWLRKQMALVSQEPLLFSTTILENIKYGKPDASMEEVVAAARMANAHDYISALPDAYNTHAGEQGVQLSGGQKQRIAIARAVLKNPKILLLDEATSALDSASEAAVQATLDQLMVGRTSVVVAHRLSTVRGADVIAVVSGGGIVEQGSHDQLMADVDGAYAKLVAAQMAAAS